MNDESASAVASPEQERSAPKKRREWIRCGVACAVCGKDQWWIFQGFNRCDCGQVLWVERIKDDKGNTRFPYRQGRELPADYPGYMGVTQ
ncbi:MAG TPA: hypothetical protein PKN47_01645 [Nitrospira sp.]|nr:hypothetical protein [Nitrospira sp.]